MPKGLLLNMLMLMHLLKQTGAVCPNGWESIGTGCYQYGSSGYVDYDTAVTDCSAKGGYPWVNNNEEEKDAVQFSPYVSAAKQIWENMWIGCTDREVEGTFKCADGSQYQAADAVWSGGWSSGTGWHCVKGKPGQGKPPEHVQCDYGFTYALCEIEPVRPTRKRSGLYSLVKDESGVPVKGKCLQGSVMATITVKSRIQCAGECLNNPDCLSFNFRASECELNSGTKDNAPGNFQVDPGCNYYEPVYQNEEL